MTVYLSNVMKQHRILNFLQTYFPFATIQKLHY